MSIDDETRIWVLISLAMLLIAVVGWTVIAFIV